MGTDKGESADLARSCAEGKISSMSYPGCLRNLRKPWVSRSRKADLEPRRNLPRGFDRKRSAQTAWKECRIFPSGSDARDHAVLPCRALSLRFFTDQPTLLYPRSDPERPRENARSVREPHARVFLPQRFALVRAYERKGMPDLPEFRDALGAIHKGIFRSSADRAHLTHDEGWLSQLGESLRAQLRSALVLRTRYRLCWRPRHGRCAAYYTQWERFLRGLSSLELPASSTAHGSSSIWYRLPALLRGFARSRRSGPAARHYLPRFRPSELTRRAIIRRSTPTSLRRSSPDARGASRLSTAWSRAAKTRRDRTQYS